MLSGQLTLGDILTASGLNDLTDVLAIRHTDRADGIPDVSHASPEAVVAYTRNQDARFRVFPEQYAGVRLWLVFMADGTQDGTRRARFYGAYDNHGEALSERTETNRRFSITHRRRWRRCSTVWWLVGLARGLFIDVAPLQRSSEFLRSPILKSSRSRGSTACF